MSEAKPKLLIVEDDAGLQRQLKWCFDDHEVFMVATRADAIGQLRRFEPPVVLQDLGLPPDPQGVAEGMATLQEILSIAPQTKVIVVTGNHDRENAVRAVSLGAYDFYEKPVDTGVLRLIVERAFSMCALEEENRRLREAQFDARFEGFIATDEAMLQVCRLIERVAPTDVSVFIRGEAGTGKEMLARALHAQSARKEREFVVINCAAIPEHLLEQELFGRHIDTRRVPGRLESADGGTLLLEEVDEMPAGLQARFLRLLETGAIEDRLAGGTLAVDLRFLYSSTKDLQTALDEGRFRQDLYFRMAEVAVTVPPLRDRAGAASVLAHSMLRKFAAVSRRSRRGFTEDAIAALEGYQWPGNVRELENRVKTAMIAAEGSMLTARDLNLDDGSEGKLLFNLKEVRTRAERQAIRHALAITNGNVSRTSELLGVSRPTLYDLMDKYGIAN